MKPQAIARAIAELTLTRKASDVLLMDLRGLTSMTDYFVVCTADSDIQVKAIADAVEEGMSARGVRPWHVESGSTNWILLDFVDVVLHVFHRNTRPFYNLEKLWGDAKIQRMQEEAPPARAAAPAAARRAKPAARTTRARTTSARTTSARTTKRAARKSPPRKGGPRTRTARKKK